jgi:hypothetical protein
MGQAFSGKLSMQRVCTKNGNCYYSFNKANSKLNNQNGFGNQQTQFSYYNTESP